MGAYINSIKERDYIDSQTKKTQPQPPPQGTNKPVFNKPLPTPSKKIVSRRQKPFKDMTKDEYDEYLASVKGV